MSKVSGWADPSFAAGWTTGTGHPGPEESPAPGQETSDSSKKKSVSLGLGGRTPTHVECEEVEELLTVANIQGQGLAKRFPHII